MVSRGRLRRTLVLRTKSPERATALLAECGRLGYKAIVGVEPDKVEDITDLERALRRSRLSEVHRSFVSRNGPCPCGSGSKYKNCCARDA